MLRQGEDASRCVFVVSGFLYQARIVGDRSQILAFHVPGDMPCLHTLLVSPMDADLVGLGPSIVGYVAHSQLKQLLDGSIHLTRAFWRETLIDAAISRQWIARLRARRRTAKVAHLICELAARLEVVGLVKKRLLPDPDDAAACRRCVRTVDRPRQSHPPGAERAPIDSLGGKRDRAVATRRTPSACGFHAGLSDLSGGRRPGRWAGAPTSKPSRPASGHEMEG